MAQTKYQRVADEIKQRIIANVYPPRTLLPDQNALAAEFGVSRITIKKALDGVAREGLIYKKSGLGTYVLGDIALRDRDDSPANAFDGLSEQQGSERVTSQIIKFEVAFPNADLQDKLGIAENEAVYDIRRLRLLDDEPFILEHTFLPVRLVPNLSRQILEKSLYMFLHQDLNLTFGGAYRRIHADLPDELDQQYLKAGETTPVLETEQLIWLINGQNIEYSTARNVYDRRSYTVLDVNDF
ncbi:GntR family transcriptional regulator [Lacticaseibacillus saniviri]|uniref:HTH-type transcriptional regulator GmuR n=1 Tax=Lacticaseibacillus saniviri JCM 17471 = DSM 24301 TaxID=1293598 RepID=A0A0R2MTW6_9LACO|nr:GntR family transcriptional regulator [Lacticaseibacillus saniviri]KRO16945.1 HTH-type transcriptional regulator GmuR [Lacticaseibacillus saniviri JCM 17471 = DSM 24301]